MPASALGFPDYGALMTAFTPAQQQQLQQFTAYLIGYLSQQHKGDGSHSAITADSLAATGTISTTGTGPHTFGGDVIAEYASGSECGMGTLSTINGTALLASLTSRHGVLFGGVASGYLLVKKAKDAAFGGGGTFEWAIYDLANLGAGTTPMLQMAQDLGNYSLIDGGTASTRVNVGNANRPMLAVYADAFIGVNGGLGTWATPTFAAGDYTSDSGSWTVGSGDVTLFRYTLNNQTMTVTFVIDTTTVSGGQAQLRIKIPAGKTAANTAYMGSLTYSDNGAAFVTGGNLFTNAGSTFIGMQPGSLGAGTWTAAVNNTSVRGTCTFEVQ